MAQLIWDGFWFLQLRRGTYPSFGARILRFLLAVLSINCAARLGAQSQVRLTDPQIQSNRFQFVLNGQVDSSYIIEESEGLVSWTPVSTNTLSSTESVQIHVQGPATNHLVFFRAHEDLSSVVFLDDFNRADSSSVGGSWSETDQSNLLSVHSGGLRLTSNADRSSYLRAAGGAQLGVKITFSLNVISNNGTQVIQVGTKGGGGADKPYRDCFGFAIILSAGVQANDTTFQGTITPFTFADGTVYEVELLIFADTSRELRVWSRGGSRPSFPTALTLAQTTTRATGSQYQIGFDSGSATFTDVSIDDFRVDPISGSNGTMIIFADSFGRPDSTAVGGDWQETDPSNLLSIRSAALRLASNADRFAYLRETGGAQLGVMMSFTLNVLVKNSKEVLQVGTKAGSVPSNDSEYRNCFGFAILPGFGVQANDTVFQGEITPFTFDEGVLYQVELLIFADNSRELRVWPSGGRPSFPTAFALAQSITRATGSNYQIGFDSGGAALTDLSVDDFRIQSITNATNTTAILFDSFDRADSASVGGLWNETDNENLLSIQSDTLRLTSNADRSSYLRAAGGAQLGVKITFSLNVISNNGTQVIQVGTKGGGGADNPYRDCFGFAVLPAFGVQANDRTFQGDITPFSFSNGTMYQVEISIAQDNSRQIRVWPDNASRPVLATLAVPAQAITLAKGTNYQIGYDSGGVQPAEFRIDDFRIEKSSP